MQTCDEIVKRFKQAYFTTYPGYYFTGDGAYRDKDGYYQITGRMDDVINVTGHRLGTAEVEDVLVSKGYTNHLLIFESLHPLDFFFNILH